MVERDRNRTLDERTKKFICTKNNDLYSIIFGILWGSTIPEYPPHSTVIERKEKDQIFLRTILNSLIYTPFEYSFNYNALVLTLRAYMNLEKITPFSIVEGQLRPLT